MGHFNRDAKRTNVYSEIFKDETHIYHLSQKVVGRPLLMTAQWPAALAYCPSLTLSVPFLNRKPSSSLPLENTSPGKTSF